MAGIITEDSFTSPFVDCPRMFGGGRWSEPQTASGAMWGWGGYGNPYVDRRYSEDVLRRELVILDDRYQREMNQISTYVYGCRYPEDPYCAQLKYEAHQRFHRDKEYLYRQFDTYNRYPTMLPPPIFIKRENMPENWSYAFTNSKSYIIIGSTGAAPKPAQHTQLSSAEAEANRLAKKHPGEEFTIYQTTKSYKVEEKPVTVRVFA